METGSVEANLYDSDSPGRKGDKNGGQTDAKGKMRHRFVMHSGMWQRCVGGKGHGEGGEGKGAILMAIQKSSRFFFAAPFVLLFPPL